ncbi:MAG: hypothetical protein ACSW8J_10080, partial [bacterium]
MADHCRDVLRVEAEARLFNAYVTDALMLITENTARYAGGRYQTRRWLDAAHPRDTRTGDEIAVELMQRAGLRFKQMDNFQLT